MKSKALTRHFGHNFDQADANNGAIYQQVVHGCIEQASGRAGSARYFKDCLTEDPVTSSNVVLRALIFNQQRLAAAWADAAVRKGGAHDMTFNEGIGKFYEAVKDTFVVSSLGRDIKGPFANLSKYLYQLAGPITERLGTALNDVAEIGLAKLPERRLMTLMLGVLQAEHPNLELVDVRGVQSPRQAAKALARAIAARSGGGAQNLYGSVEALISEVQAKESALFRGLFLIDRARLKTMQGANNAARLTTVKPETFEGLLETSNRGLFNAEVKAGVIGAILNAATLGASYRELIKSDGKGPGSLNFASGVASLIGGSMETTGRVIEKMPWAESPISLGMRNLGLVQEFNAKWLVGTGQWVGIIGGVLAGALQMWEGWEERTYNPTLGFAMMALGFVEGVAAFLVLAAWPGVGLVIGLFVMAAIWAVGHFKTDDIQKWLAKSKFGLLENGRDKFHSLMEQQTALSNLAAG
jgi:hypothetical protein